MRYCAAGSHLAVPNCIATNCLYQYSCTFGDMDVLKVTLKITGKFFLDVSPFQTGNVKGEISPDNA